MTFPINCQSFVVLWLPLVVQFYVDLALLLWRNYQSTGSLCVSGFSFQRHTTPALKEMASPGFFYIHNMAFLLSCVIIAAFFAAEASTEKTKTVEFNVKPGGVVHSFTEGVVSLSSVTFLFCSTCNTLLILCYRNVCLWYKKNRLQFSLIVNSPPGLCFRVSFMFVLK